MIRKTIAFLIDTLIAYVMMIVFAIPYVNVLLLRHFMRDSKEFSKRLKKLVRYVDKEKRDELLEQYGLH